jgi:hypothetical protein
LRQPVGQRTGWQCGSHASAKACRTPPPLSREVAVTGHGVTVDSACFPSRGPSAGSALPSAGCSEASSPASRVLRRCATPWVPRAALRFLRLAIPGGVPVVSLPAVPVTATASPGLVIRSPRYRKKTPGDDPGLFRSFEVERGARACEHVSCEGGAGGQDKTAAGGRFQGHLDACRGRNATARDVSGYGVGPKDEEAFRQGGRGGAGMVGASAGGAENGRGGGPP